MPGIIFFYNFKFLSQSKASETIGTQTRAQLLSELPPMGLFAFVASTLNLDHIHTICLQSGFSGPTGAAKMLICMYYVYLDFSASV